MNQCINGIVARFLQWVSDNQVVEGRTAVAVRNEIFGLLCVLHLFVKTTWFCCTALTCHRNKEMK